MVEIAPCTTLDFLFANLPLARILRRAFEGAAIGEDACVEQLLLKNNFFQFC